MKLVDVLLRGIWESAPEVYRSLGSAEWPQLDGRGIRRRIQQVLPMRPAENDETNAVRHLFMQQVAYEGP